MARFIPKKGAANVALAAYARLLKRRELLRMQGKVPWIENLEVLRADRVANGIHHPDAKSR